MTLPLQELMTYLEGVLKASTFSDYCPNGLQVEGRPAVSKIIGGVTASQALIDAAIARNADAILVHHGYFWKSENACIAGMKRQRLRSLLINDISLIAYHLPLDVHAEFGNNICLARELGLQIVGPLEPSARLSIGLQGTLAHAQTPEQFAAHIARCLGRTPQHIAGRSTTIRTIGWCTGAAQGMIEQAASLGLDAFISGEISEPTVHIARECGVHYFAAGHHATERYGVQALGAHLAQTFGIQFEFVDIDNPV